MPNGPILESLDGGSLSNLGALVEPIGSRAAGSPRPDEPGHGIVFDRAVLATHAVEA